MCLLAASQNLLNRVQILQRSHIVPFLMYDTTPLSRLQQKQSLQLIHVNVKGRQYLEEKKKKSNGSRGCANGCDAAVRLSHRLGLLKAAMFDKSFVDRHLLLLRKVSSSERIDLLKSCRGSECRGRASSGGGASVCLWLCVCVCRSIYGPVC